MATSNEASLLANALHGVSSEAQKLLGAAFDASDGSKQELEDLFLQTVKTYGSAAESVGEAVFQGLLGDKDGVEVVKVGQLSDAHLKKRLRWALESKNPKANLLALTDELVKQPARDLMEHSSTASGVAWARIPSGKTTCAFCLMLAGRGAVYHTAEKAGDLGNKFHAHCDCQIVPIKDPSDWPEHYDPKPLEDLYYQAREAAEEYADGVPSTKAILAEMRKLESPLITDSVKPQHDAIQALHEQAALAAVKAAKALAETMEKKAIHAQKIKEGMAKSKLNKAVLEEYSAAHAKIKAAQEATEDAMYQEFLAWTEQKKLQEQLEKDQEIIAQLAEEQKASMLKAKKEYEDNQVQSYNAWVKVEEAKAKAIVAEEEAKALAAAKAAHSQKIKEGMAKAKAKKESEAKAAKEAKEAAEKQAAEELADQLAAAEAKASKAKAAEGAAQKTKAEADKKAEADNAWKSKLEEQQVKPPVKPVALMETMADVFASMGWEVGTKAEADKKAEADNAWKSKLEGQQVKPPVKPVGQLEEQPALVEALPGEDFLNYIDMLAEKYGFNGTAWEKAVLHLSKTGAVDQNFLDGISNPLVDKSFVAKEMEYGFKELYGGEKAGILYKEKVEQLGKSMDDPDFWKTNSGAFESLVPSGGPESSDPRILWIKATKERIREQYPELFESSAKYGTHQYRNMNFYLRTGEPAPAKLQVAGKGMSTDLNVIRKQVKEFQQAIDLGPGAAEDLYVMRGVRPGKDFDPRKVYTEGNVLVEPAFTSTSMDKDQAKLYQSKHPGGWMTHIKIPKGTRIGAGNPGETEIVLPPGVIMHVVKVDPVSRQAWVEVEDTRALDPKEQAKRVKESAEYYANTKSSHMGTRGNPLAEYYRRFEVPEDAPKGSDKVAKLVAKSVDESAAKVKRLESEKKAVAQKLVKTDSSSPEFKKLSDEYKSTKEKVAAAQKVLTKALEDQTAALLRISGAPDAVVNKVYELKSILDEGGSLEEYQSALQKAHEEYVAGLRKAYPVKTVATRIPAGKSWGDHTKVETAPHSPGVKDIWLDPTADFYSHLPRTKYMEKKAGRAEKAGSAWLAQADTARDRLENSSVVGASELKNYKISGYSAINKYLRDNKGNLENAGTLARMIQTLDATYLDPDVSLAVPKDMYVARGVPSDFPIDKAYVEGKVTVEAQYTSTTVDKHVVKAFQYGSGGWELRYKLAEGTRVVPGTDYESETVLARNSVFHVDKVDRENRIVWMTQSEG